MIGKIPVMKSAIDLTKVTPYKIKRTKRTRRGNLPANVTTESLQRRAEKMEAAEKRKREKAKKDAERLEYLLSHPKQQ